MACSSSPQIGEGWLFAGAAIGGFDAGERFFDVLSAAVPGGFAALVTRDFLAHGVSLLVGGT
jgi:hypothetical protein